MGKAATEQEKLRQAKARLRRIQHYEHVTHNVSQTCRFGVTRALKHHVLSRNAVGKVLALRSRR